MKIEKEQEKNIRFFKSRPKPNWDFWKECGYIPIWKAICLSYDIEPHERLCFSIRIPKQSYPFDHLDMHEEITFFVAGFQPFCEEKFKHRLEIIKTHLVEGTVLYNIIAPEHRKNMEIPEASKLIDLTDFVIWINHRNWSAPDMFKQIFNKNPVATHDPEYTGPIQLPYSNDELKIIKATMETIQAQGNRKLSQEEIKSIIERWPPSNNLRPSPRRRSGGFQNKSKLIKDCVSSSRKV